MPVQRMRLRMTCRCCMQRYPAEDMGSEAVRRQTLQMQALPIREIRTLHADGASDDANSGYCSDDDCERRRMPLKIAILSRSRHLESTEQLFNAAVSRGHEVRVLDTLHIAMSFSDGMPELRYANEQLSHYDAIIPRIGASITYYGTAVVRQFERLGVYTPSTADGIINSRDKFQAMQVLCLHDIGMPDTTLVSGRADVKPAIARVGGVPLVIKLLKGTHGIGVMLARDANNAEAMLQTLLSAGQSVLLQSFVSESSGRDMRVVVVGDQAVAAIYRQASGDEFRSNVHLGAKMTAVEITPEYGSAAVSAAQAMGLEVAGVDLLESKSGPMISEVNSSPGGMEQIRDLTGIDVAGKIIEYIAERVSEREASAEA